MTGVTIFIDMVVALIKFIVDHVLPLLSLHKVAKL